MMNKCRYLIAFIVISVFFSCFFSVKATEYENNDASVYIKYLDTEGNEILPTKIIHGKVGEKYFTVFSQITNYRQYGNDPENKDGIFSDDAIEVIYVYEKIPSTIVVSYIDVYTGDKLYEKFEHGYVGEKLITYTKQFDGYELVISPSEEWQWFIEDTFFVSYYYIKKSNVVTKYIDINTNKEIKKQECVSCNQWEEYSTNKKDINGYTYISSTDNTKGIMEREDIEVKYYYKKNTEITVKYLDMYTNEEIANSDKIIGLQGEEYTTSQKNIDGYKYYKTKGKPNGKLEREPSEVIYQYIKISNLNIKYVDEIAKKEIKDKNIFKYGQGENYRTNPVEIEGYTLISIIKNFAGTMGPEDIEVNYYYKKNTSITVKYVDISTNEEISEKEVISGLEGDEYNARKLLINGYEFIEQEGKSSGIMEDEPINVIFKYRKNSHFDVNNIMNKTNNIDKINENINQVNTGDMPVIFFIIITIISIIGLVYIVLKNKLFKV